MLINGEPEERISINDRGLLYGDGLFETIRVIQGRPVLWKKHFQRLLRGCSALSIDISPDNVVRDLQKLLDLSPADGIVKIIISRGAGGRGYQPPENTTPTRILQFHALPADLELQAEQGIKVMICRQTIGQGTLAGHKHLNRLEQVLAAREITDGFTEGLMLNIDSELIEGTRSNLFIARNSQLFTPDLRLSGVSGVMREYLLEYLRAAGQVVSIEPIPLQSLYNADEAFLCNSVAGIWPIVRVQHTDAAYDFPIGPMTRLARSVKLADLAEPVPKTC
ncbi:MAG: aminodeoxychorismate lyase [Pseudohongiellaceae bacterium]